MPSTPQDPKDEAPVTGTTPEGAPQAVTPDPAPPAPPATPPPLAEAPEAPGQHAAPRPYPASPPQVERTPTRPNGFEGAIARERPTTYAPTGLPPQSTTPPTAPLSAVPLTGAPLTGVPVATAPQGLASASPGVTPPPPAGTVAATADRPRRELPEPPAKPGIRRHLLAGVLGLVLTPFAMLLIGVGTSRLSDIAGTSDMGTDLLGISLLALGLGLLAAIVLLGAWSTVLPIVGGLVWGVGLGVAYLTFPNRMENTAEAMTSNGSVPVAIEQLADAAMSGYLLVLGTLMVAAGVATAFARRRGRRWAERVALAERARADAARADAERSGEAVTGRTVR